MSDSNKAAIALILVLLFGAGGYLWYSQMYKPAVAERLMAEGAKGTAEAELQTAQGELEAAQQQIEQSKQELSKLDDSVPRVQLARKAVPNAALIDDAAIVLMDLADQAGVSTSFEANKSALESASFGGNDATAGATPIDLTFEAGGTYAEMMLFMSLVEGTVSDKDGKLYARDRLFNVVKLELGGDEEEDQQDSGFGDTFGQEAAATTDGPILGPNDLKFTVVVRMYTSSTENAQSVGAETPDPAAAGTDPNAAGADPNAAAAGTDPNAAGGGVATPADPAAAGPTGGA